MSRKRAAGSGGGDGAGDDAAAETPDDAYDEAEEWDSSDVDEEWVDDEPEPVEQVPDQPTGRQTGWQKLSKTFLNPPKSRAQGQGAGGSTRAAPKTPDFSRMTDAEKKTLINQIDPLERKIGYAASALAAVITLIATIPYMVTKTLVTTSVKPTMKDGKHYCATHYAYAPGTNGATGTCKGYYPASHYAFYLIVLLIFALAIFVTVRIGRRAPLAFTMVLTGLALGSFSANTIVVLPFLVGGGWLLLRAWRSQRYGHPTAKAPVPGYVPPARGAGSRAGAKGAGGTSTTNASRRSRKGQPAPSATGRQGPTQNKRYTPKAPPKKKPGD